MPIGHGSQEPPPIDWEAFKKETNNPELVAQFQSTFEGATFPKYQGTDVADAEAAYKKMVAEADEIAVMAAEKRKWVTSELARLEKYKASLEDVTISDILEDDPDLKKSVQGEIQRREWY